MSCVTVSHIVSSYTIDCTIESADEIVGPYLASVHVGVLVKLVRHSVQLVDVVRDGVRLVLYDGVAVDVDDGEADDDVEQREEELDRQGHPLSVLPHPVDEEERLEHLPG